MAQRYDAVIIGGGHNGLISRGLPRPRRDEDARPGAPSRARRRRRHRGGLPGLPVLVFSYVVSLLRPEIIRELDLPQHGLDILPLDGTFTPLRPGEGPAPGRRLPVAGQRPRPDHPRAPPLVEERRRGLRGIRPADGRHGPVHQADPVDRPARPGLDRPAAAAAARLASLRAFQKLTERQQAVFVQLMTMSASDFLDQWFETDPLKATMSASGIIGTYQGDQEPRHRVRAAPPLHGRDRRRVPRLGHPEGRHRRHLEAIGRAARSLGRRDPDGGAGRADPRPRRPGDRRRPRGRRGDPRRRGPVVRSTAGGRSSTSWSRARWTPTSRPRSGGSSSAARRAR